MQPARSGIVGLEISPHEIEAALSTSIYKAVSTSCLTSSNSSKYSCCLLAKSGLNSFWFMSMADWEFFVVFLPRKSRQGLFSKGHSSCCLVAVIFVSKPTDISCKRFTLRLRLSSWCNFQLSGRAPNVHGFQAPGSPVSCTSIPLAALAAVNSSLFASHRKSSHLMRPPSSSSMVESCVGKR